jgi:acyl carrier protein
MQRSEITRTVVEVLGVVLKRPLDANQDHQRAQTPGWDSLKHVEIIFALEDALSVEFAEDELVSLDSVSRIVDAVAGKHAARD